MKKGLLKFIAFGSVALLMLSACKKDGSLVTSNGGKAGALKATASTLVLDRASLTDTSSIIRFSFTQASYGYDAGITNTLQIDAAGDNWATPATVSLSNKVLSQGYSTADFNALMLKLGLKGDVAGQIQVRILHSNGAQPIYSNVLSLTVTPFNLASFVYVVGQFNGYSTATPDSLLSATSNGIYKGIINFPAGQNRFLILPAKNFNNKYATTESPADAASLSYSIEYVSSGGNDLYAPSAGGNDLVTLDINAKTITVEPANSYSVIGSTTPGGNFSTDVDFKFVNSTAQDWEGVFAFTNGSFPGSFKVRQNHDWTWSWGIPKAGSAGDGIDNTLNDSSNDNLPIATSGSYKVTFAIPLTPKSTTTPSVLATYSITKQ